MQSNSMRNPPSTQSISLSTREQVSGAALVQEAAGGIAGLARDSSQTVSEGQTAAEVGRRATSLRLRMPTTLRSASQTSNRRTARSRMA